MAKTFNRRPLQVNTPSSNDVKNYFFNHCNWKGVNNDKNFLTVDQETFADAKNVYVNAEGLLTSRPSVKGKNMFFNSAINFWNFDDVDVYFLKDENGYQLNFVKDGKSNSKLVNNEKVKLVRIQNNIFCFTDNDFFYFNTEDREFGDGFDKVYVPTTVFDVKGEKTSVEKNNFLTDKEKIVYSYNTEFGISTEAYGKELTVKVNDNDYNVFLKQSSLELITDILFKMPEDYNHIDVSKNGTYLFYSATTRTLSYSATGKTLSKTFMIPVEYGDLISYPKFSQDSSYVIIGTEKSLYIVSVIADKSDGQLRFPIFTDVKDYIFDFEWNDLSKNETIIGLGYDFSTYDDFVYFRNIYDEDEDFYRSVINYVNLGNVNQVSNDLYEIDGISLSIADGLIVAWGSCKRDYIQYVVDLFSIHDIRNIYEYIKYDKSTFGKINNLKIINNEVLFIENTADGRSLSRITPSGTSFETIKTIYTTNLDLYEPNDDLISDDGLKVFFDGNIYFLNKGNTEELVTKDTFRYPIHYGKHLYYFGINNDVFSNRIENVLEFSYIKDGPNNILSFDFISKLNEYYFASGKNIYVSDYREEDGEFRWYLPETYKQTFDKTITGLQPISSSEMGVFFDDEIWYVHKNENVYYATKTKLELGIKFGSDITISYDGSRLIFPTERGIVALSYQDFVASTDQVLTFLSDAVHVQMKEFCKKPVSIFKNDYWIFFYHKDSDKLYVFDIRNNSWWPWSLSNKVKKFVNHDNEIIFLSTNGFCRFNESTENYFDYDGKRHPIEWSLTSQKLHLSQINNYKHIINMTFNSVIDTDDYLTFLLEIANYRERVDSGKIENLHYNVDVLRTFVQRLNYFKVNEFQYTLRYDDENKIPLPLSLSSIGIKYKIQGQVR